MSFARKYASAFGCRRESAGDSVMLKHALYLKSTYRIPSRFCVTLHLAVYKAPQRHRSNTPSILDWRHVIRHFRSGTPGIPSGFIALFDICGLNKQRLRVSESDLLRIPARSKSSPGAANSGLNAAKGSPYAREEGAARAYG